MVKTLLHTALTVCLLSATAMAEEVIVHEIPVNEDHIIEENSTNSPSAEVVSPPALESLHAEPELSEDEERPEGQTADGGNSEETQEQLSEATEPKPAIERQPLEIEGVDHPLTATCRERYLGARDRAWIVTALKRSIPYRPYIQQQLKEKNLPSLLQYLPIVESYYNVEAVSSTKATGIWQFMENSMAPYLKKSSWYDERRDPWKSTDAALAKLEGNYKQFGDWALAIAAYNCGAGAMARTVKANPGKDFWYLAEHGKLKAQTTQYIPKLLAIADLIDNALYYELPDLEEANKLIEELPVDEFDYLTTEGMYSFKQISTIADIEEDTIKLLNPALFRNCTPARLAYQLRLPLGATEGLEEKLKAAGPPSDAIIYTVVEGDTLWGISRRYKLTVDDICQVNNIKENGILRIKQKLIIPVFK